jgi:hypothetical protein
MRKKVDRCIGSLENDRVCYRRSEDNVHVLCMFQEPAECTRRTVFDDNLPVCELLDVIAA